MNDKKALSGPGTVVGVNVKLVGTLSDANEIIVHGKIEGEVISEKNVNISETAYIKGPVSAEIVQIAGEVHGSIVATGKLEILPTGKVFGSTTTKDLNIRSGAIFIGKSNMPEGDKEIALPEGEMDENEKGDEKEANKDKAAAYEVE
jgi:cytoskeletal protein CcmA (bactofilin family)